MQVEGICQYDAVEGLIGAVGSPPAVKRLFNVDGRDVVGEQDDLVGMKLSVVLPCEIGVQDQRGLEQPDEEDAGAGERVEDMNALVAQASAELLAHYVVGAVHDEIHDFHRRVDDAEAVRILLEGRGEELLVELHQHVLARVAVVEAPGTKPHAFVEAFQIPRFVLETELSEIPTQGVQRLRHRVAGSEIVMLEQRLEDRPRQDVLCHHFDGVVPTDRLVDRDLELLVEGVEPLT